MEGVTHFDTQQTLFCQSDLQTKHLISYVKRKFPTSTPFEPAKDIHAGMESKRVVEARQSPQPERFLARGIRQ
jgi:hypothetical protein